jgi:hypothetical protein
MNTDVRVENKDWSAGFLWWRLHIIQWNETYANRQMPSMRLDLFVTFCVKTKSKVYRIIHHLSISTTIHPFR